MAALPASIGARVAARARASPPIALAGGGGASTLLSHLAAEHSHGRGLLCFFDNAGARTSLARVCREFRREVAAFRWPVVELRGHTDAVYDVSSCPCSTTRRYAFGTLQWVHASRLFQSQHTRNK